MSNQKHFSTSNPFHRDSRLSTSKKPPPAPPKPPPTYNYNNNNNMLIQKAKRYEQMYKQTKNQLEVLKSQYRGLENQLKVFQSQKHLIDTSHSNILSYQKTISNLEMKNQNLMDKNGLFLQQKNTYLLELSDIQKINSQQKNEIKNKNLQIEEYENKITKISKNYTENISKKDNKYNNLKKEYNSLNQLYINKNTENELINQKLNNISTNFKDIREEYLLCKDKYDKLKIINDELDRNHCDLQLQISRVKGDSSIAVQVAQKKDQNIIKDLRRTLKTETIKCRQFRAEYLRIKDEVNDLRVWRENYLRDCQLKQTQNILIHSDDNDINDNDNDNQSTASASNSSNSNSISTATSSNHTSSSNTNTNSKTTSNNRNINKISIKNRFNIIKKKSVKKLSSVSLPSFQTLVIKEFGGNGNGMDDYKVQANGISNNQSSATAEYSEVIAALSDRLAIVKENYMNLKNILSSKNNEIESLNNELNKKKEMIADLIEKLNDKPLPPTPQQLNKLEQAENEYIQTQIQSDEDKVLINLEEQGLSGHIQVKDIRKHIGYSNQLLTGIKTPSSPNTNANNNYINKRKPPTSPPPKVIVSPSYNHNNNPLKRAIDNKYIFKINDIDIDQTQSLIINSNSNDDIDNMNGDGI